MPAPPPASWAILMPDGSLVTGGGDGPTGNVTGLLREAVASMFVFKGTRLFVAGPVQARCTTDLTMEKIVQRLWSFASKEDGFRLWLFPNGTVGLARTQEEVGQAIEALQSACRRPHAGDQRRQPG